MPKKLTYDMCPLFLGCICSFNLEWKFAITVPVAVLRNGRAVLGLGWFGPENSVIDNGLHRFAAECQFTLPVILNVYVWKMIKYYLIY